MLYCGTLFRALNPVYAREPLSGKGAALYGGRFNPRGLPALYSSLTVMTALREANQAGSLQPTTLVSYDAEIDGIFDSRDEATLKAEGMDAAALADSTWRDQMKAMGEAATQVFARRLIAKGYRGLLVRSFVKGSTESDLNLVLWQWSDAAPARLTLIDDEGRLSRQGERAGPTRGSVLTVKKANYGEAGGGLKPLCSGAFACRLAAPSLAWFYSATLAWNPTAVQTSCSI